jgi:hypothetical protein
VRARILRGSRLLVCGSQRADTRKPAHLHHCVCQDAPLTAEEADALLASLEASLAEELHEEGAHTPAAVLHMLAR